MPCWNMAGAKQNWRIPKTHGVVASCILCWHQRLVEWEFFCAQCRSQCALELYQTAAPGFIATWQISSLSRLVSRQLRPSTFSPSETPKSREPFWWPIWHFLGRKSQYFSFCSNLCIPKLAFQMWQKCHFSTIGLNTWTIGRVAGCNLWLLGWTRWVRRCEKIWGEFYDTFKLFDEDKDGYSATKNATVVKWDPSRWKRNQRPKA